MADPYIGGITSSARNHALVTPSDTVDIPENTWALYANTDGPVVVRVNGQDVTYQVQAGTVLTVRATRVLAAGTTAQVVAWYT